MPPAFEAVDADRVTADLLGLKRMPHRGALVNDLDAGRLERRHILLWAAAGGFDDLDPALLDRGDVFRIWRRAPRREEGEIDPARPGRHGAAARDLLGQQLRCLLREAGDDAQSTGA